MQISSQKVVTFHYTLTNDDDEVLDSSDGGDPLAYIHGTGNLISGLEQHLEGKEAGDQFAASIAPAQAYGERDEELVQTLSMENFAGIEDLRVGQQLEASGGDDDESRIITVAAIEGDRVTVDGNHPLAGQTLHFDVDVVSVREAAAAELDHGHVHGPGGHHH